ncbi:MAG: hypothetical protein LBU42_05980 [Prevotellaceae bacterium]|jgi:hypothetical protein|nr:hypothetical protein [Prevotellaceae bacterium]
MGQDELPCPSRGAQAFRYVRTVRRAKGSVGLLPQAALRLSAVMKIRRFTPYSNGECANAEITLRKFFFKNSWN